MEARPGQGRLTRLGPLIGEVEQAEDLSTGRGEVGVGASGVGEMGDVGVPKPLLEPLYVRGSKLDPCAAKRR